jgi:xylose isomerase
MNFDAKLRRQSIEPVDLYEGHIGGIDTLARAFLCAAALHESAALESARTARYAGWKEPLGTTILGGASLEQVAALAHAQGFTPKPESGRQERLENVVNRFV